MQCCHHSSYYPDPAGTILERASFAVYSARVHHRLHFEEQSDTQGNPVKLFLGIATCLVITHRV